MGIRLLLAGIVVALYAKCTLGQSFRNVSTYLSASQRVTVDNLAQALNLNESYSFTGGEVARTARGKGRQRAQLVFNGMEVMGSTLSVPVNGSGFVAGNVVGTLTTGIENAIDDVSACFTSSERLMQETMASCQGRENRPRRNVREEKIIFVNDSMTTVACTLEFVMVGDSVSRPFFVFDACDPGLRMLMHFDKLQNHTTSGSRGRPRAAYGRTRNHGGYYGHRPGYDYGHSRGYDDGHRPGYGSGRRPEKRTSRCQWLKDTEGDLVRPPQVTGGNEKVGKLSYGVSEPLCLKPAVSYMNPGYMDAVNGGFGPAHDAFFAATESCRMYKEWYGIKCLPSQPQLGVHFLTCLDNAFWDGTAMLIGDGCDYFYPFTDVDVVAHELAHGVTEFNSDLIYANQSGGMNEHFSDFAAEAVQNFIHGSNDWLVQGLPIRQAFEVSLHANRAFWKPTSDFQNGACDFMRAAYDLGYDVTKVHGAFDVVDINLDSCDFEAFGETISLGETRQNVRVSKLRNPIFKLDVPDGISSADVLVSANDYRYRTQIKVSITSDSAGTNSVTTGTAPFHFRVTDQTNFIQFSAYVDEDVTVQFTIKEREAKPYYGH